MTGTPTKNLAQVAEAFIAAFNAGDWPQFRAPLAPNVVYEETGTQRRTQSADEYLQLVQGWKQAFPDVQGTIHNVVSSGNTVVQEITWVGTQTGPLSGPGGTLPASGKQITVRAALWVTFQGDTMQEIHHYLDVLSMMQQLGALPAAG
jgi:steroid delta-isomerase-like uncharacterized protein